MDILVHTGSTKAGAGTSLVARAFESPEHEQVCLLLQYEASGQAAKTLEEECAVIVQHSLLGSEGEPWQRLDGTLKELNGLFRGLMLGKTVTEVNAVVSLLDSEGGLHVSHAGRGEAYLVRGGLATQITEFTRGKPVEAFVHISSGAMEQGDGVVFSTQRLLRTLTPAQLAAISLREGALDELLSSLEAEREMAAIAIVQFPLPMEEAPAPVARRGTLPSRRAGLRRNASMWDKARDMALQAGDRIKPLLGKISRQGMAMGKKGLAAGKSKLSRVPASAASAQGKKAAMGSAKAAAGAVSGIIGTLREKVENFLSDLRHPQRKRRAHLLLLAGAVVVFLVIWMGVSLSTSSQRNKTRAELSALLTQIDDEMRTADNRHLAGDNDSANAILQRAEGRAKQVMDNESGLFRVEALNLLDKIRQKREELENITRLSPRIAVNLTAKNASISAQGLIGIGDGEFVAYDRQDSYRVLLNKVDEAKRITDDALILQGASFPRYNAQVFLTTGNSLIELSSNQVTSMKTDDPAGWVTGKDVETYLRYLYVLAPEKKQIYKYERLANRYSAPVEYNVNADLTGALDMSIDGSVYVLKEGGTVLSLLRGEVQPFPIHGLPQDALKNATKMYKVPGGNFYFLDPTQNRIIMISDGGTGGEPAYLRQYVLEGEQLGTLQDLYVDPQQSHLYVLDEKRVYVIDIEGR